MTGLEEYGRIEGFDALLREEKAIAAALRATDPRKQPRRRRNPFTAAVRLLRAATQTT